jgi:EAL and modified HD-GYP domain-containing signal transduction protein
LDRCADMGWPKEKVVLAVPAPAMADLAAQHAVSHLAEVGYTIALHNPSRDLKELRRDADFVSICALDADSASAFKFPAASGGSPRPLLLVREVETEQQHDHFRRLGFHYFEGAFFERPKRIHGCEILADRLAVLQLIARLQDVHVEIDEVEDLVSRDLTLSYKLLRLLNAAYFGMPKRVDSIRRGVIFFGLQRIKNWATVILVNSVDFRPRELLTTALVRARTCELLAQDLGREPVEPYYVAGLFSLLDAIMDAPMAQILERLSLTEPITTALLKGTGAVGEVLRTVLLFERGAVAGAPCRNFSESHVPTQAYLQAIRWASETTRRI